MKKVLPIHEPLISFVPENNFIFSIIDKNSPIFYNFIFENYVQICSIFNHEWNSLVSRFVDDYSRSYLSSKCIQHFFIPSSDIIHVNLSVREIVKKAIDNGYYVLSSIDELYIAEYGVQEHVSHAAMIYGYNEDDNSFLFRDFFGGKYKNARCSYSEMEEAITNYHLCNIDFPYAGVLGIKDKKEYKEAPDYALFSNSLISLKTDSFSPNTISYGLGSWFSAFIFAIESSCSVSSMIMNFHFLSQHALLMSLRTQHLSIFFSSFQLQQVELRLNNLQKQLRFFKNKLIKYRIQHGEKVMHNELLYWKDNTIKLKEDYCSIVHEILFCLSHVSYSSSHYKYL